MDVDNPSFLVAGIGYQEFAGAESAYGVIVLENLAHCAQKEIGLYTEYSFQPFKLFLGPGIQFGNV